MQTFKKKERLTERKFIADIFENGNEFVVSPVRVLWKLYPSEQPFIAKILITVPVKNFRKAVDRNRIKRLVRESYRKNKQALYDAFSGKNKSLVFVLQYTGKTILSYKETEDKIILILKRLIQKHEENPR